MDKGNPTIEHDADRHKKLQFCKAELKLEIAPSQEIQDLYV